MVWNGGIFCLIGRDSGPHEESTPFQGRATHRFAHCSVFIGGQSSEELRAATTDPVVAKVDATSG